MEYLEVTDYIPDVFFELLSWHNHFTFADTDLKIGINCLLFFEICKN